MLIDLLLLAATIACIVHTVHNAVIFDWFRRWMDRLHQSSSASRFRRWTIEGFRCSFCLSHWIGFALAPLMAESWREALMIVLPAVWLANHLMPLHGVVMNVIGLTAAVTTFFNAQARRDVTQQQQRDAEMRKYG